MKEDNGIAYSCKDLGGPWKVVLWGAPDPGFWYIRNVQTGVFKKVGRVGAERTNYLVVAENLARQRNRDLAAAERLQALRDVVGE